MSYASPIMDTLKVIASCLYIFGVPAFVVYLLTRRRKRRLHLPGAGLVLFVIGGVMSLATLATYIPMLSVAWQQAREQFVGEAVALAVWFLPSAALTLLGWILRTPPTPTR